MTTMYKKKKQHWFTLIVAARSYSLWTECPKYAITYILAILKMWTCWIKQDTQLWSYRIWKTCRRLSRELYSSAHLYIQFFFKYIFGYGLCDRSKSTKKKNNEISYKRERETEIKKKIFAIQCFGWYLRNRMNCNFMTFAVSLLYGWIVCIFVRYEICCFNVTTVWIFTLSIEDFFIKFDVIIVNSIIECDCNHHWNIFCW